MTLQFQLKLLVSRPIFCQGLMAVPFFIFDIQRQKIHKRRKLLEDISNFEIQQHTGLPAWGIRDLVELFQPISGLTKSAIPLETRLLCYLAHLRSGSFQWCLGSLGGISQSSVSRIIDSCLDHTLKLARKVIHFPESTPLLNQTKEEFYEISRFPNVLGVIDGTQIPIKAPTNNESIFVCRKQFHSINAQVIAGPDHSFFDVVAKWPGSTHDSFIYNNSGVKQRLSEGEFGDGWLLGKMTLT